MTVEVCIQAKTGSCLGCSAHRDLGKLVRGGMDVTQAAEQIRQEVCVEHKANPQTHNLDTQADTTTW